MLLPVRWPSCCIRSLHSDTAATFITAVNVYETAFFRIKLCTASVQRLVPKYDLLCRGSRAIVRDPDHDRVLWVCNRYIVMWTHGECTHYLCVEMYATQLHSDDMYCSSMCFYKLIFASQIVHAKRLSSNMCIDAEARTYALFKQARTLGKVIGYHWNWGRTKSGWQILLGLSLSLS